MFNVRKWLQKQRDRGVVKETFHWLLHCCRGLNHDNCRRMTIQIGNKWYFFLFWSKNICHSSWESPKPPFYKCSLQLLWNYKLNLTTDPKFESVAREVCKSTIAEVSQKKAMAAKAFSISLWCQINVQITFWVWGSSSLISHITKWVNATSLQKKSHIP